MAEVPGFNPESEYQNAGPAQENITARNVREALRRARVSAQDSIEQPIEEPQTKESTLQDRVNQRLAALRASRSQQEHRSESRKEDTPATPFDISVEPPYDQPRYPYTGDYELYETVMAKAEVGNKLKPLPDSIPDTPAEVEEKTTAPRKTRNHTFILPDLKPLTVERGFVARLLEYAIENRRKRPCTLDELTYQLYHHTDDYPTPEERDTPRGQEQLQWLMNQVKQDITRLNARFRKENIDWSFQNVEPKWVEVYGKRIRNMARYKLVQPERQAQQRQREQARIQREELQRARAALIAPNRVSTIHTVLIMGLSSLISPQNLEDALLPRLEKGEAAGDRREELLDQVMVTIKALLDKKSSLNTEQSKLLFALNRNFKDVSRDQLPEVVRNYINQWIEERNNPSQQITVRSITEPVTEPVLKIHHKENQPILNEVIRILRRMRTPQPRSWVVGSLGMHGLNNALIQQAIHQGIVTENPQTQALSPRDIAACIFWLKLGKPSLTSEQIEEIKELYDTRITQAAEAKRKK